MPSLFLEKLQSAKIPETQRILIVDVSEQTMTLFEGREKKADYSISTAKNGIGQKANSFQTPLGLHRIREKIGKDVPEGGIFETREFHSQIWSSSSDNNSPTSDLITSRILWLEGLEPSFNSGNDAEGTLVDSYQRYIYIHGTNHEDQIGKPASRGCVRMLNADVIRLFDIVQEGDLVWIQE